jgi:chemotaxis protein methyltransferase CheR
MEFLEHPSVPKSVMVLFRDLIQARTGIFFPDNQTDLMLDKINVAMAEAGVNSLLDYYYRLKYDDNAQDWTILMDSITVRETFFWREVDQIRALVDVVVPSLAPDVRGALKIWCAACASGEEPLSIAMALQVAGWFDRLDIEIHGSDASEAALRVAQTGVYRERCFRSLPPEYRERFFTRVEGGWKILPALHRRVQWHRVNLTNACDVEGLARVPVIFCRNVFIYFSEPTILKVAKTFEQHMSRPGYLFLGAAESLLKFDVDLELQEIGGAFVYVKRGTGNNGKLG